MGHSLEKNAADTWFEQFGQLHRQNGYFSYPSDTYKGFLPFIRRSGRILELGCGNGMLLRYLGERVSEDLIPFGVDLNRDAINTARTKILPNFADNFQVADVRIYEAQRQFDIVLTNPIFANPNFYQPEGISALRPDGSIRMYLHRCRHLLAPGGDLVLYSYEEEHQGVSTFASVFALESEGLGLEHGRSPTGSTAYWIMRGTS